MDYCFLGDSGLEVSTLGLGTIPFGTEVDEKTAAKIVDMYYGVGGNLIDTSNLYGGGMRGTNTKMAGTSERTVGKAIKGKRDKFILATKGYWLMEDEVRPNSVGLSRTYLARNIENSLKRLGTDYIDLYQCHAWDFYTPVEETMRVLDDFVRAGKIRYVGVSNWDGWHVVKANTFAKHSGLTKLVSNQIWYNLADRVAEHSVVPACRDQKVSILAWGIFAQGFLTGRYRRGAKRPDAVSRFDIMQDCESSSWAKLAIEKNWASIDVLDKIAQTHSKSIANIVIQWSLQAGACDVILLGFSREEQFTNIIEALDFELTAQEVQELNNVSEIPAPAPMNFLNLFCKRQSEYYGGLR